MYVNKITYVSRYTASLIHNTSVILSKYHMLQFLSIETSDFENNHLHVIKLKNLMKEVNIVLENNDNEMDIDYWDGRGKIIIIIPSVGQLRYNRVK